MTLRGPVLAGTDLLLSAEEARRRDVPRHLLHAFDLALFTSGFAPAAAMPYLRGKSWIALEARDELRSIAKRRLEEWLRDAGLPEGGETTHR